MKLKKHQKTGGYKSPIKQSVENSTGAPHLPSFCYSTSTGQER